MWRMETSQTLETTHRFMRMCDISSRRARGRGSSVNGFIPHIISAIMQSLNVAPFHLKKILRINEVEAALRVMSFEDTESLLC